MADPNQQPDWMTTLGQKVNPGVESLLSAVPALLGAYESARGVPIGAPLQALGNLGLQHAANRQATAQEESDVAGRSALLRMRGLYPQADQPQFVDTMARLSPKAQQAELTDIENQAIAAQNVNWQFKTAPDGKAYMVDPRDPGKMTRMPTFDDPDKAREAASKGYPAEFRAWKDDPANRNGTYAEFRAFKDGEARRLHDQEAQDSARVKVNTAPDYVKAVANAKLDSMSNLPTQLVPGLRDKVIFDRTTGQVVTANKITAGEFWNNSDKYVAIDKTQANTTIPKLQAMRRETIRLFADAAKVLPKSTGDPFTDWVNTRFNVAAIPLRAMAGDVSAQDMLNLGSSVALQYQQILTGTTRPMNATEFANVSGIRLKGEGIIPEMTHDYKAALVPRPGDTREQAAAKASNWATLYDAVMQAHGFTPKQSMVEELNRQMDAVPAAPGLLAAPEASPDVSSGPAAPPPPAADSDTDWH